MKKLTVRHLAFFIELDQHKSYHKVNSNIINPDLKLK